MQNLTTLLLKLPRNTEITPESAQTFLAALTQINGVSFFQKLMGARSQALALEIILSNQQIKFAVTCETDLVPFVETQIQSNYPLVIIEKILDPIFNTSFEVSSLVLRKGSYYPIKTFSGFTDVDPLASVLSVMAKGEPDKIAIVQYALESVGNGWQSGGQRLAETGGGKKVSETGGTTYIVHPDASVIKEKISFPGFKVTIRVAANSKDIQKALLSSFGVFSRSDGNSFSIRRPGMFGKPKALRRLWERSLSDSQVLNISELATVWHLPSDKIKTSSIAWGTAVLSEPPENLPTAEGKTEAEMQEINFFGKALYKNHEVTFGIKNRDRQRHIWTVGKTGTGKSTLIATMAVDDLKKGRGLAVIDPHGELCETLMEYVPSERLNDVIYFNPADREFPIALNPLEVVNKDEAELVVSGIVSIFYKLFGTSWGPRLEYILRNTLLTLAYIPSTTLEDVITILTNASFRQRIIDQTTDPVLKNFWVNEFNKMPDKLREESISPILNKVGQFVSSPLIRRIIGQPKSSIRLEEVMDEGKILFANLSQGRLGEDNAALLGAMIITKIQLAAMRRVDIREELRRDFYLYVDEFQNFATTSFVKILSEARKYRLNLYLANQYMAQIPEEVQSAILGNAGSMIAFAVGASDAEIIGKEFSEVFSQGDLVNLSRFQVAIKLMIDWHVTRPFFAHTLPLPDTKLQTREAVIESSRLRWGKKFEPRVEILNPEIIRPRPPMHHNPNTPRPNFPQNDRSRGFRPKPNDPLNPPHIPKPTENKV